MPRVELTGCPNPGQIPKSNCTAGKLSSHSCSLKEEQLLLKQQELWADSAQGEQQAGTGWMQSHGLGLGRKTGCNWKGQFIRETSHCREVTTHWKGSRPAEGGQSSAAAQIYIPQPQPQQVPQGEGLPGTQLMFHKQPERASSKVPKKASPSDNS